MELLERNGFRFCPGCGTQELRFAFKNMLCKNCGFVYYQNTAVGVAAIISRQLPGSTDREVLLVVRVRDPGKGCYDLPGGFVDPGENLEEALLRELDEELGCEIGKKLSKLEYFVSYSNDYEYKNNLYKVCDIFFSAELQGEVRLLAADDVEDFIWCHGQDIDFERIAFQSVSAAFKFWLEQQG